jgi:hypothetical protein
VSKPYPIEFQRNAVQAARNREPGVSLKKVASDFGIHPAALSKELRLVDSRIIWHFWDSGIESAPEAVRTCLKSWSRLNPSWDQRILDDRSLYRWLDPSELLPVSRYPSVQKRSNHIRLMLLIKYGGIWVDADVYCHEPLDNWLPGKSFNGLFFFKKADHVPIASWLISNIRPHESLGFLEKWEEKYRDYFLENSFRTGPLATKISRLLERSLSRLTGTNGTNGAKVAAKFWLSRFTKKFLRITPYFVFHYLWAETVSSTENFRFLNSNLSTTYRRMEELKNSDPAGWENFSSEVLQDRGVFVTKVKYRKLIGVAKQGLEEG